MENKNKNKKEKVKIESRFGLLDLLLILLSGYYSAINFYDYLSSGVEKSLLIWIVMCLVFFILIISNINNAMENKLSRLKK